MVQSIFCYLGSFGHGSRVRRTDRQTDILTANATLNYVALLKLKTRDTESWTHLVYSEFVTQAHSVNKLKTILFVINYNNNNKNERDV